MLETHELAHLIEENAGHGVEFGTAKHGPSGDWIAKAEQRLGCKLPASYVWFLSNYGGGEVCGSEVFSLYCMDFDSAGGGDIVFQYLAHQRTGTLDSGEIPLMQTDFGEVFYFCTRSPDENGEFVVMVKRGDRREVYAENFVSFLIRVIKEFCEA